MIFRDYWKPFFRCRGNKPATILAFFLPAKTGEKELNDRQSLILSLIIRVGRRNLARGTQGDEIARGDFAREDGPEQSEGRAIVDADGQDFAD